MVKRRCGPSICLAVILLTFSSCDRFTAAPEKNACYFLKKQDVEAVLKERFDEGKGGMVDDAGGPRTTSCTFTSTRFATPVSLFHREDVKDSKGSMKRFLHKAQKTADMEVMTGVGDAAVWDSGVGQLTAFAGPHMFIYSVLVTQDMGEAKRISLELASLSIQRSRG